jgi:tetratricopeptide (TPR) repeat protein
MKGLSRETRWLLPLALSATLMWTHVSAQTPARRGAEDPNHVCGMIYTNHYGPFDYRTERHELKIVEDFHFTAKVEALQAGQSGWIGGDLDYTLRASPNHHRALYALVRWTDRKRSDTTEGQPLPLECYFDRAIRFRPDDTIVRAMYAQFLHKRKRTDEAHKQLESAVQFAGDNAITLHNLGLVYLETGAYDKALELAHRAAALGYEVKTLRNALAKQGRWREPTSN